MPIGSPRSRRCTRRCPRAPTITAAMTTAGAGEAVEQAGLAERQLDQRQRGCRGRPSGSRPPGCGTPPTRSGSTGRRTRGARRRRSAGEEAAALLAVGRRLGRELLDAVDLDGRERRGGSRRSDPPTSRAMAMPPDCGRRVVVLGEQLGLDVRRRWRPARRGPRSSSASIATSLLGDLGRGAPAPRSSSVARACARTSASSASSGSICSISSSSWSSSWRDAPLERPDLVLQRLELARVADGAAVERLVVLDRPCRSALAISSSRRCWSRPSSWRRASTSAVVASSAAELAHDLVELGRARGGALGGGPAGRWWCRAPGRLGGRPSGSCPLILARQSSSRPAGRTPGAGDRVARGRSAAPRDGGRRWCRRAGWSTSWSGRRRERWSVRSNGTLGRPPPPPESMLAVEPQVPRAPRGALGLLERRAPRSPSCQAAHVPAPDLGRVRAAGDARAPDADLVVVLRRPDPHRGGEVGREADEPAVAGVLRGAGLAGGVLPRDPGPGARAAAARSSRARRRPAGRAASSWPAGGRARAARSTRPSGPSTRST